MILDLLIKFNKIKLNRMISKNKDYEIILKQSQKLDKYITEKTIYLINKHKKNKSMGAWKAPFKNSIKLSIQIFIIVIIL